MATSRSYTKCLKSTCEIVIVYAGWYPATCTWDASHIPELNTRTSHSEVFCKKRVIKSFTRFAGKHLSLSPFLIKLKAWRPATFFCILRILRNFQQSFFAEHLLVTNSNITFFFSLLADQWGLQPKNNLFVLAMLQ